MTDPKNRDPEKSPPMAKNVERTGLGLDAGFNPETVNLAAGNQVKKLF